MKKIRFDAKTIPNIGETQAKIDAGFKNFEIQLIHEYVSEKEYNETDKIIDELGGNISVVHTPLIVGTCNELTLDELLKEKFYSYFIDACKYAEYIARKENKRIKVVIHNAFAKYLWEETNLMADIGMDSLDVTELILTCQTTFRVNLDMATAANIRTVGDLLDAINTASPTA